jgi:hypothetical protein
MLTVSLTKDMGNERQCLTHDDDDHKESNEQAIKTFPICRGG